MRFAEVAGFLAALLFLGMLGLLEVGRRIGAHRIARDGNTALAGAGAVDAAVFAILGLLLAFTFSGAAVRFEERRSLIVDEANAIGTAYLRLDLLEDGARNELRALFGRYVDARLGAYSKLPDVEAAYAEVALSARLQEEMWRRSVAASGARSDTAAFMLLLPALNEAFDIASTRMAATEQHPPEVIFGMVAFFALMSAMLVGVAMASGRTRAWTHTLTFAAIISVTFFVILDLEYPRFGLIRVDKADHLLTDLRRQMPP